MFNYLLKIVRAKYNFCEIASLAVIYPFKIINGYYLGSARVIYNETFAGSPLTVYKGEIIIYPRNFKENI